MSLRKSVNAVRASILFQLEETEDNLLQQLESVREQVAATERALAERVSRRDHLHCVHEKIKRNKLEVECGGVEDSLKKVTAEIELPKQVQGEMSKAHRALLASISEIHLLAAEAGKKDETKDDVEIAVTPAVPDFHLDTLPGLAHAEQAKVPAELRKGAHTQVLFATMQRQLSTRASELRTILRNISLLRAARRHTQDTCDELSGRSTSTRMQASQNASEEVDALTLEQAQRDIDHFLALLASVDALLLQEHDAIVELQDNDESKKRLEALTFMVDRLRFRHSQVSGRLEKHVKMLQDLQREAAQRIAAKELSALQSQAQLNFASSELEAAHTEVQTLKQAVVDLQTSTARIDEQLTADRSYCEQLRDERQKIDLHLNALAKHYMAELHPVQALLPSEVRLEQSWFELNTAISDSEFNEKDDSDLGAKLKFTVSLGSKLDAAITTSTALTAQFSTPLSPQSQLSQESMAEVSN